MKEYRENYPVPDSIRAEYEDASRLNENGLTQEAREILLELLKLSPNHPRLLNSLANTYYYEQKYDIAEELYLDNINVAPDFCNPYCNLCMLYSITGRTDIATKYADKALECGLKSPASWRSLGIYYAAIGELDTALDYFTAAYTLDSEYIIVSYDIGCVYIMLGEVGKGLPYIEKSLFDVKIYRHALIDPDIDSVRDLPEFQKMMKEAEKYHLEERNENTTRPEDTLNDERFGYK